MKTTPKRAARKPATATQRLKKARSAARHLHELSIMEATNGVSVSKIRAAWKALGRALGEEFDGGYD